jgi:hypothetical protein
MPRRTTTIVLDESVTWFGKAVREITVREPNAGEFLKLGEPIIWGRTRAGVVFNTEREEVIEAYLNHCLSVENGSAIFSLLSLSDGQKIKGALLAFFTEPGNPATSNPDGASSSSI